MNTSSDSLFSFLSSNLTRTDLIRQKTKEQVNIAIDATNRISRLQREIAQLTAYLPNTVLGAMEYQKLPPVDRGDAIEALYMALLRKGEVLKVSDEFIAVLKKQRKVLVAVSQLSDLQKEGGDHE